ncbi:unnamed protein product [Calypogeia fissa]
MGTRGQVTLVGGIVTSEGGDDPPHQNLRVNLRKEIIGGEDKGSTVGDGLGSTDNEVQSTDHGTEGGKNIPQGVQAWTTVVLQNASREGVGGKGERQL